MEILKKFNSKNTGHFSSSKKLPFFIFTICVWLHDSSYTTCQTTANPVSDKLQENQNLLVNLPSFGAVAEKIQPSVVGLFVTSNIDWSKTPPVLKFFKEYFGNKDDLFQEKGVGSGIIIDKEGYILTSSHVVENVDTIKAVLHTGKSVEATVVGFDEATDIAVVKIEPQPELIPATLGDSEKIKIGDWVVAIGTPFGLRATLTVGVISAIGRHDIGPPQLRYQDLIQTDAPVNPGNSGGPLVDLSGRVIGITTAITASGQGIGFAIPINMAKKIVPILIKNGNVPRSWLGVTVQKMTDLLAISFGLDKPQGALVVDVAKGSPAWISGIQVSDIIVEIDGNKINEPEKLSWFTSIAGVGKKIDIKIIRNGAEKQLTVKLAPIPQKITSDKEKKVSPKGEVKKKQKNLLETIKVAKIDEELSLNLGIEEGGVIVTAIEPDSPFATAGVEIGDVIIDINGVKCLSASDFHNIIKNTPRGKVLRFYIISRKRKGFIALIK